MKAGGSTVVVGLKAMLVLGIALHFHRHFQGPPFDYAALGAGAFASWVGVPGPGEPLLIAAGVFAAQGKLGLGSVLFVAFVGATAGGIAGWVVGLKAGRVVLTRPGPLHRFRLHALGRGDALFDRHPVTAILLTPSWLAGIHQVRTRVFLPTNAAAAGLWAIGIGLGAYFIGPTVVDFVDDLGLITGSIVVVLIGIGVVLELRRRLRAAPETTRP